MSIPHSDLFWLADILIRRSARQEKNVARLIAKNGNPHLIAKCVEDGHRSLYVAQKLLDEASRPPTTPKEVTLEDVSRG